jgi:predicted RNA binding protein YcfA (HicA-like mRNA interferase family)
VRRAAHMQSVLRFCDAGLVRTGSARRRLLNQRTMKKLLEANGWVETVGGKHVVKMEKPGNRPITLPANKRRDYPRGLRAAILKQAGLLDEEEP